jgi:hypothetical protein
MQVISKTVIRIQDSSLKILGRAKLLLFVSISDDDFRNSP